MYKKRLSSIQEALSIHNLDAFFVTNPINILYLTSYKTYSPYTREGTLIIRPNEAKLFVPKIFHEEVKCIDIEDNIEIEVVDERHLLFSEPLKNFDKNEKIGFEAGNINYAEYLVLTKHDNIEFIPFLDLIEGIRLIKYPEEIEIIRKVNDITDKTFDDLVNVLHPGISEQDIARMIQEILYNNGAEGIAFTPIVAHGKNSSMPHYSKLSNKKIKTGMVLIDFGAKYKGYNGDLSRMVYFGEPNEKYIKTYELVNDTSEKTCKFLRPGTMCQTAWKKVVDIFGKEAKFFAHGLGHGIGLEVHEPPYLRSRIINRLKSGMTLSIEPALYYPGWGGIRIEDFVLITDKCCEILSNATREMIVI